MSTLLELTTSDGDIDWRMYGSFRIKALSFLNGLESRSSKMKFLAFSLIPSFHCGFHILGLLTISFMMSSSENPVKGYSP